MKIEDIKQFFETQKELNKLCLNYFLINKPFSEAIYCGWNFYGNNFIEIKYFYNDYYHNNMIISLEDLIKTNYDE